MTAYFKEHARISVLCFSVWFIGAILGIYTSSRALAISALEEYISDIALGGASFWRIFANGAGANAVFVSMMLLSSFFVPLIPLGIAVMSFRGFASGFGSALLIGLFPSGGVWVALGAVVLPLIFALPLQFMIFVSCLDTALHIASDKNSEISREYMRIHTLRMFLLFSALCLISAVEAIISPYIFLMI